MAGIVPFIPLLQQGFAALIDHFWPNTTEMATQRAAALAKAQEIQMTLAQSYLSAAAASDAAQAPVNLAEAQAQSFWKSGGRPGIIWCCALALFSDYIVRPYCVAFFHVQIPPLDWTELGPLMFGVLGLGAYRTVEKVKGVA